MIALRPRRPSRIAYALVVASVTAVIVSCGEPMGMPAAATSDTSTLTDAAPTSSPSTVWLPELTLTRLGNGHALAAGSDGCRYQLDVQLSVTGDLVNGALLSDRVDGACDTLVLENKRFYEMRLLNENCGSKTYEGLLAAAGGLSRLRLVDHSQRRCRDRRPFTVELSESHGQAPAAKFGGNWP